MIIHRWVIIKRLLFTVLTTAVLICDANGGDGLFNFKYKGGYAPVYGKATAPPGTQAVRQGFGLTIWESNLLIFGRNAMPGASIPTDSNCVIGIGAAYPSGSCNEHLYLGEPWIGVHLVDTVNGTSTIATNLGHFEQLDIMSGLPQNNLQKEEPIWNTSVDDTAYDDSRPGFYKRPMNRRGYDDDGDGKIDEDELDGLDNDHDWIRSTDDIGADGVPDSAEVGCRGKYDPVTNPDPAFDDYDPTAYDSCHLRSDGSFRLKNDKSLYTELNGIPDHGEPHVDEDYGAVSDNDFYVSATDTSTGPVFPKPAMGLKVFYKSYAFQTTSRMKTHRFQSILHSSISESFDGIPSMSVFLQTKTSAL